MKYKQLFINILMICFSLVFALGLSEASLRIINHYKKKPVELVWDDILKYKAVPGSDWQANGLYIWDQNGFRNKEVPKKVDVVAFGDSTTVGFYYPLEKSWPSEYGRLAGKTVYQMALPNYSIVQHSNLLDKALEMDPEIVVLGFYMGNDIFDAYERVYTADYWKHLRSTSSEYQNIKEEIAAKNKELKDLSVKIAYKDKEIEKNTIKNFRIWLRNNLQTYALLADASYSLRVKTGVTKSETEKVGILSEENPELSFLYKDETIGTVLSPSFRLDTVDLSTKAGKEGFRITKNLILEMNDKLKAKNKKLLVMIIPTKEIVYGNFMSKRGESFTEELKYTVDVSNKLDDEINKFCEESEISCLDTTNDLIAALENKIKIFSSTLDSHPTDNGYKVIAESLNKYLQVSK